MSQLRLFCFYINFSSYISIYIYNQILDTVVSNCLIQANESRYTSIAFPALGAGARGYPGDIVSYAMNRAIDSFLKTTPTIYIKSIRIVIFNDKEMIKVQRYWQEI